MLVVRRATERGHADLGWLNSYHTFSFADYYDPQQMAFGPLRVINEDRVQPGKGFGAHSHRDMEIISYVLEGALEHKDSIGTGSVIKPGDVQRMSAGNGVTHSEFNASQSELVHFLQIWIVPKFTGIQPSYEQKFFAPEEKRGRLRLVASPDGRDDSAIIHQDALVFATVLSGDQKVTYELPPGRLAYVHVARGKIKLNGEILEAGDGAKISAEPTIALEAADAGEALLFDLPQLSQ
ncbi:MAG: pirin family protein [Burkholderiales bacterium]|nr:pirin family protein [Burkholderiales bacterium]